MYLESLCSIERVFYLEFFKLSLLNQFPKKALNHLLGRINRAQYNWSMLRESAIYMSRVRYYRSRLFPKYQLPNLSLSELGVNELKTNPIIMDKICMPPYYSFDTETSIENNWVNDHDDIRPLLALISSRQPKVIVELGTAHGNTTANIFQQNPEATIYTVNAPIDEQTGEITTFDLTYNEVGCVYKSYEFAGRINQIYKNTLHLDMSEYFDKPIVDFVIIDACHDEDYVINDFLKVEPFIASGGMVLLHDTHPSMKGHLMGSYVGCMKLRAKGYDIQYLENTWWGIWIKRSS